ncbi:MAG: type II secretion system F family protein [Candidatus Woesearchaeota archaeon]
MPEYKYESLNNRGVVVKGTTIAINSIDLIRKIEEKNEHVVFYKKILKGRNVYAQNIMSIFSFKYKLSKSVIEFFLDNLQLLLDGGYTLIDALSEIFEASKNKKLKKIIRGIISSLESGDTLYEAMSSFEYTFDPFVLEAVKIGEESGTIVETLKEQVVRLKKESDLSKKIKSQSIYPVILFTFVIGLFIVLNLFVLPQMIENFEPFIQNTNVETKTEQIININKFLVDYGLFLPFLIFMFIVIWKGLGFNKETAYIKDLIKIKIPVVKDFIIYSNIVRICNCLQIGIKSGFTIVDVLSFTEKSISNNVLRVKIVEMKELVMSGSTFTEAVKEYKLDNVFTSMVTAAESTGDYPYIMGKAYNYYMQKIDSIMKTLFTFGNFLIILLLGIIIGFAMMSILVPMYELPTMLG